jgi:two-component system chemotaxis response regulator CheB
LIAQHIAPGFTDALVHWLSSTTGFDVRICNDNDKLEPSVAYLCPEGFQTGISNNLRVKLAEDDCMNGVRPSVSYLFASMSEIAGKRFAAILLTGMGRDGAEELKILRDCGSTVTIVQDAETSLVHGMPGEAIKLGAAQHVVSPQKIVEILLDLACAKRRQSGN